VYSELLGDNRDNKDEKRNKMKYLMKKEEEKRGMKGKIRRRRTMQRIKKS
jgi:hypothetical protein